MTFAWAMLVIDLVLICGFGGRGGRGTGGGYSMYGDGAGEWGWWRERQEVQQSMETRQG